MKICPKCSNEHSKNGIFCSRKCANSRIWSEADKLKKSEANKGKIPSNKGKCSKISKKCLTCSKFFTVGENSTKKYCCGTCNPNWGGYREGSGKSKSGFYKGIYCGSSYELIWVIFQIEHGKQFSRFEKCLSYNGKRYYPDFIQDGILVEIKGYEDNSLVEIKNDIARNNGYDIIVLRKDNLAAEFDYVYNKYGKDVVRLYDNYKPKFYYVCECCNKEFVREKKRIAKYIVCSRSCSLKMNRKVSGKNQYTKLHEAADVATSPSN